MSPCAPPSPPLQAQPSLTQLVYRYLFFAWLFRDASRGNLFERAAAWQHNQGCAHWLPVYMRRWLVLGLLLFALGWWAEALLSVPQFSVLFYVPSILTVHVNVVAAVVWLGLKRLPPPV